MKVAVTAGVVLLNVEQVGLEKRLRFYEPELIPQNSDEKLAIRGLRQ
jgi:hypothetical protein